VLIPIYGFLAGDTLGVVVLVHDHQTVREVMACLIEAAACRVAPPAAARVRVGHRTLNFDLTVAQAGLTALSRVDVGP
jgi:hypothetical protein